MKISKKFFSLITCFMMVLTLFTPNFSKAAEKPELKVTLDKTSAYAGEEFTATISLDTKDADNISGLQTRLKFDPNLLEVVGDEPTRVMPSQTGEFLSMLANSQTEGFSSFTWANLTSMLSYNGEVYKVTFKVKEGATAGITSLAFDTSDTYYPVTDGNTKVESTIINADFEVKDYTIALDKTTKELNVGGTDSLTLTFDPADQSTGKTVTWESSNSKVATVIDGNVTAVGPGTATVKAKVGSKEASCVYTVKAPLTAIAIDGDDSVEIIKNQTKTLSVTYNPENTTDSKDVKWESSDETIATVDNTGKVKAIKAGTVTIKATSVVLDTITDSVEVTVTEIPLNTIAIEQTDDINLDRYEQTTLTVIYNPEDTTDDKTVTWSSSDEDIAKVDENGVVTALKEGEVTITAKVGNKTAEKTITVTEYHLKSIDLSESETKLNVNGEYDISVTLNPDNCTDDLHYQWKVSDESIISLSSNGVYKALKEGKATITVRVTTEYGEVFEEELEVEVVAEPVADTPVTENTNDDKTSPKTGDLPIVTIVVVAALTLAGSVVVAKKKLIKQK